MRIGVLRLGHRIQRDKRITTHVALVARAYGADEFILTGDRDEKLIESVRKVARKWGGNFKAYYSESWRQVIREWRERGAAIIHLTMYGINLPDIVEELRETRRRRSILIVVGGEKVPGELYGLADYNVAVSNQPHSEVAALATLLDWLQEGEELKREYPDAELRVIPQKRGKKVVRLR